MIPAHSITYDSFPKVCILTISPQKNPCMRASIVRWAGCAYTSVCLKQWGKYSQPFLWALSASRPLCFLLLCLFWSVCCMYWWVWLWATDCWQKNTVKASYLLLIHPFIQHSLNWPLFSNPLYLIFYPVLSPALHFSQFSILSSLFYSSVDAHSPTFPPRLFSSELCHPSS